MGCGASAPKVGPEPQRPIKAPEEPALQYTSDAPAHDDGSGVADAAALDHAKRQAAAETAEAEKLLAAAVAERAAQAKGVMAVESLDEDFQKEVFCHNSTRSLSTLSCFRRAHRTMTLHSACVTAQLAAEAGRFQTCTL